MSVNLDSGKSELKGEKRAEEECERVDFDRALYELLGEQHEHPGILP